MYESDRMYNDHMYMYNGKYACIYTDSKFRCSAGIFYNCISNIGLKIKSKENLFFFQIFMYLKQHSEEGSFWKTICSLRCDRSESNASSVSLECENQSGEKNITSQIN